MKFQIILLFFFSVIVKAQTVTILDANTRQPVSFATLLLKQGGKIVFGTYASENGTVVFSKVDFDVAEVSCIGYKTVFIAKDDLKNSILLAKDAIALKEVVITKKIKPSKPVALGYLKTKRTIEVMAMQGAEVVVFIPNPANEPRAIESFTYKGYTVEGYKFAFRLHFYKIDTATQEPGEELAHEDIVRYVDNKSKRFVETNVTEYGVIMPADGVYAGIEWLSCTDPDGVVAGEKDYKWYNSNVEYTDDEAITTYCRQRLGDAKWIKTSKGHNAAYGIKVAAQ
ncbi:hypothetical protein [Flavobacterium psychrotrophum]|uniref:hypothetical protein n=1 Tax=Flavobacterium psychrotrophum TaxID=2294119 RepID=UPI000E3220BE|nr:hypothetical protein [Flavobacterium psychrotrophum]